MTACHPAINFSVSELLARLNAEVSAGNVSVKTHPIYPHLMLYCYTKQCVYERAWNDVNVLARGLIIDAQTGNIIAFTYPKFYNVGEMDKPIPDLAFDAYEKLDGSLIAVWHYNGEWHASTKGSFESDQARWASTEMHAKGWYKYMLPGTTYLFEAIYPENKIVIPYGYSGLVLHGAYNSSGMEYNHGQLAGFQSHLGCRMAKLYSFSSVSEMLIAAKSLPFTEEGWVLRFEDGYRLKVKGDEYKRIHAAVSNLTPLNVWQAMLDDEAHTMRRDLPEEFWADFDSIRSLLGQTMEKVSEQIFKGVLKCSDYTDKQVGLILHELPEIVRKTIFTTRKQGFAALWEKGSKSRKGIFQTFRPTGNKLPGYTPSWAVRQVMEEI